MLQHPNFDPVAIGLGPVNIHWYGIMYLLGFTAAWFIGNHRAKQAHSVVKPSQLEDLIVYCALGVIIGGRLGYVFFYKFDDFLADPISLFKVWEGGMAFHGGLLGVIAAIALYARKIGRRFSEVMDFTVPMVPIGLGLGRLGNFIGQELYGRASDVPWAMVFPKAQDNITRHPSQLYQAFLEGLVLFIVIYWFSAKRRPPLAISALFLTLYGVFRLVVEFFRQPDAHLADNLLFGWMTRGQQLSIPMVVLGFVLFIWAYYRDSGRGKPVTSDKKA